jgi:hypothetical protein
MYASNAGNSTEGLPSSMIISTGATEGDAVDEGVDGTEVGTIETESEDEDLAATRRYWEVKQKKEGIHKV